MIETSPDIGKLVTALHAAHGELEGVTKNSINPHFKNRYANLEAVIETAKPTLHKHGLVFSQAPGAIVAGAVEITTIILHTSGEWMSSTLHVPLAKTDPQGVGSAISYGRRYSLMSVLGLPAEDDDGEAAHGRGKPGNGATDVRVSSAQAKRDGTWERMTTDLNNCTTMDELKAWTDKHDATIKTLPHAWVDQAREAWGKRAAEIKAGR